MSIYNIETNSNLLLNKMEKIINKSETSKIKKTKCKECNKDYEILYSYNYDNKKIKITDNDIHNLRDHQLIDIKLYNKISMINFPNINYCLINTNSLNIIDGLYEDGSNEKYIEEKKNIFTSKINRYSEHSGFIYFKDNKINKIVVLNDSRVDKADPIIYMPENCIEALKVDYLYHTHPKTPYIGSRAEDGIIYEFPSISDILHYVDHHNSGRLLGSFVFAPEGVYMIHKYNLNRDKIKIDYDLMIKDLKYIFSICYNDSIKKYKDIQEYKINNVIKIPDNYFYDKISTNFEYINNINKTLIKYDLYIDYYPRIKLENNKYWIFPDIYVPLLS